MQFKFSLILIVIGIVSIGSVHAQSTQDNFERFGESARNAQEDFMDKKSYLCIKFEELMQEGDSEDLDEEDLKYKEDCDKTLENLDYFEKKEILKKYD
jgi:hypothetical protein